MRISDWSADVCSSNLADRAGDLLAARHRHLAGDEDEIAGHHIGYIVGHRRVRRRQLDSELLQARIDPAGHGRSEERRVGKECVSTCRSRWSPYQLKKKKTSTLTDRRVDREYKQ